LIALTLCLEQLVFAEDPLRYSIERTQITIGAASGKSESFSTEDSLLTGTSAPVPQESDNFSVAGPIRNANIALAIGSTTPQGNRLVLDWSQGRVVPPGSQGFNVYRQTLAQSGAPSRLSPPAPFVKINDGLVQTTSYADSDLTNGTYQYLIYLVDAYGRNILWSYPFQGAVEVLSLPVVWVDFAWGGGEAGTEALPHNTFDEGVQWVLEGGTVRIRPGTCNTIGRITKPMRLEATGMSVVIGKE